MLSFTSQGCCCYGSKLKLSRPPPAMPQRGSAAGFSSVFSCHHRLHHHQVHRRNSPDEIALYAPALARLSWEALGIMVLKMQLFPLHDSFSGDDDCVFDATLRLIHSFPLSHDVNLHIFQRIGCWRSWWFSATWSSITSPLNNSELLFHAFIVTRRYGRGAAGLFESGAPWSHCLHRNASVSNPIMIPVECYSLSGSITTQLQGT